MTPLERLRAFFVGDDAVERIVPAAPIMVWLLVFTAAAMAALATATCAAWLTMARVVDNWAGDLAQSATVVIDAPLDEMDAQAEAALTALLQVPGITAARLVDRTEQEALLAPWLGALAGTGDLPLPRLILIEQGDARADPVEVALALEPVAPGARYADHGRWRDPMVAAVTRLQWLAGGALLLIGLATTAMVTLAAQVALSSNADVIGTLRLIGATDGFIVRTFVRRLTLRTVLGALIGTGLTSAAIAIVPDGAIFTGLGPSGGDWALMIVIPVLAGAAAFFSTRGAAFRMLRVMQDL
ncbi:MAG: FtsX-like permease family protein [Pseudomonadota bacterium]